MAGMRRRRNGGAMILKRYIDRIKIEQVRKSDRFSLLIPNRIAIWHFLGK
jgi:hypothetical protein